MPTLCHFKLLGSTFHMLPDQIRTSLVFSAATAQIRTSTHSNIANGIIYSISIALQTCLPGGLVVRIPRFHRGGRGSIPRLGNTFSLILVYIGAKTIFPPI